MTIERTIAREIDAREQQVSAAVALLDGGATVPFIARYRKEVTGGLDDTQLRALETRLGYLRELEDRRVKVLESIRDQGKLSEGLERDILAADSKIRLEDLYLPYKPRRRTKAQIAREAGLDALADRLFSDRELDPEVVAADHLNPDSGFVDIPTVLDGARQILMERFAEDAPLIGELREFLWAQGRIRSRVVEKKRKSGAKFSDYFDHQEPLAKTPSHRVLALFRARNEGVVSLDLVVSGAEEGLDHPCARRICARFELNDGGRPADVWLRETAVMAWRFKISLHLTLDLFNRARETAEDEAIRVFSENMKDILLAAPAGARVTMGLDPGLRTGVKLSIVDATGKLVTTATIYPHAPQRQWKASLEAVAELCKTHGVTLVAIGNGTASRETDQLVKEVMGLGPDLKLEKMMVSEAGASVYSASAQAADEFPDLDVSLRGAVSIARRLQDPLAELVKIDPKAIGVGQYQHDVNQVKLAHALESRVEDCVNAVGVDLNTASAPLLTRVAGLNATVAENIVAFRDRNGRFTSREQLLQVPRLGPKAYEQAAGFLRIKQGDNPLDRCGVHPESYPVVERMLTGLKKPIDQLLGNAVLLKSLKPEDYVDHQFGVPTVVDILAELEKPGRDPRGKFQAVRFADGVEGMADLKSGMILEGVVSNVTNFGAFVDVGVHQDGLVHISQLADHYVKDPRQVVKAGDIVRVRVQDVDIDRKRIGLSMRLEDRPPPETEPKSPKSRQRQSTRRPQSEASSSDRVQAQGAMADALAAAFKGGNKK